MVLFVCLFGLVLFCFVLLRPVLLFVTPSLLFLFIYHYYYYNFSLTQQDVETQSTMEPFVEGEMGDVSPSVAQPLFDKQAPVVEPYPAPTGKTNRNSRVVKRRWSLVRMAVKQIGVLGAFKAMKNYRTIHSIEV